MKKRLYLAVSLPLLLFLLLATATFSQNGSSPAKLNAFDLQIVQNMQQMVDGGRQIFRFDTFGDEAFWGDTLKLHQAIEGEKFGGVGVGLSPKGALDLGLKVDVDALPADLVQKIRLGKVDLNDPANTL